MNCIRTHLNFLMCATWVFPEKFLKIRTAVLSVETTLSLFVFNTCPFVDKLGSAEKLKQPFSFQLDKDFVFAEETHPC